ncbi:MAG: YncE family protein [Betaproteobacteria bacterium]|nr:YncE family protein [Betaproteobacteria bacterium]
MRTVSLGWLRSDQSLHFNMMAVNPATNKIYMVNSNTVLVIDGATNIVSTIATGIYPDTMVVNPATNKIYVSNNIDSTIRVIDGATNSSSTATAMSDIQGIRLMAVNSVTNKIYLTSLSNDTVLVIDGATNTISTVATGLYIGAMAVNSATNKIYVSNNIDATIRVIDGATNSSSTVAAAAGYYSALAVNRVTNKIYVLNPSNNTVTVIDGETNTTSTLATGTTPRAIALNEKTNKIYVANYGSNSVTVIDGATNTSATVAVGTHPNSLAVNPETDKVYVTSEDDNAVTVIDSSSVVEFYNTNLDNYFLTANASEASAIDGGSAGPGWIRTGNTFKSGGSTAVCRFYGSQSPGPNSHFYTLLGAECDNLKQLQATTPVTEKRWNFESLDFLSTVPINGTCASGLLPVYRAYNNGFARGVDSNHRISASQAAIQEVINRSWINEGVVMCAPN